MVRASGGELILVCNPDLVVQPGAVTAMADRLQQDQSLGLVGPALISRDGTLQPSGRAFPSFGTVRFPGRARRAGAGQRLQPGVSRGQPGTRCATGVVDWVTGACFLVRREAFDAVGGFTTRLLHVRGGSGSLLAIGEGRMAHRL